MLQIKSKFKIGKRLGASVFEKCQTQKFILSETRSRAAKRGTKRGLSDYCKQMLEKQKVRYTYGLTEHQFRRYVDEATHMTDSPKALHEALELRLDNVVYRAGLAKTRRGARQMVSHGHVTVHGRRVTVPSLHMKNGDTFSVREGSRRSSLFLKEKDMEAETRIPAWLSFDGSALAGKVIGTPTLPKMGEFDYRAVFEFYSR